MNKLGIPLLCLAVVLATGCREYRWYGYKTWSGDILGGELHVFLRPNDDRIYREKSKRYSDRKGDYSLIFAFYAPYEYDLAGFQVKDIKMLGKESGRKINLPDLMSNAVSKNVLSEDKAREHPGWQVDDAVGYNQLEEFKKLPYETYVVTFTVIVYGNDSSFREETLVVQLNTDFQKYWISDVLAPFLSV